MLNNRMRLDWDSVFPRTPFNPRSLLVVLVALVVLMATPVAGAKECGKSVIDQYFNTGRIAYHQQACYSSALKQIDPDARMYSGIMGAIRAARARDATADAKATNPTPGSGAGSETPPPQPEPPPEPPPEPTVVPDGSEVIPLLAVDSDALVASVREVRITPAQPTTTQAAIAVPTLESRVPLGVILLGGLASVLTLVGVGGLTVRWLDQSA